MAEETTRYFAHSGPRAGRGGWEPLAEHLSLVAERAALHASAFGRAEEARAAGLLHDLGKYGDIFVERLKGKASKLDHWSIGAFAALMRYRREGVPVALAVQGHHVGLQSGANGELRKLQPQLLAKRHPLGLTLTDSDLDRLLGRLADDRLELPRELGSASEGEEPRAAWELDVRMLFSALVDADYVETEAHFRRDARGQRLYRQPGKVLDAHRATPIVEEHVRRLTAQAAADGRADPRVLHLRQELYEACVAGAELPPGTFTLSAPTGAGKTLAMLAFALRHARRWGLRRVVLAVPYLSILEQTVKIYRDLFDQPFGREHVLEHHSLAGTREASEGAVDQDEEERQAQRARELAENWDAPIVLTTSVQLLESLHANRPRPCRKLHRLAESVVMLDEVQTLPPELAVPTLATLSHLAERYRSSVVFATATQPAFDTLSERVRVFAASGWAPQEIVSPSLDLFTRIARVDVCWRIHDPLSWQDLAAEIADRPRVLVIVNLKRHAVELVNRLRGQPGVFHLSTNMCPLHRQRVLDDVRKLLEDPAEPPCRLISTQCVEAGVDIDFPVLYRALAPLDSVAQAAGRCNRHGKLPGRGQVIVFHPDEEERKAYPPGGYRQGAGVTRQLLRERGEGAMDLQDPDLFRSYYKTLYSLAGHDTGEEAKAAKIEAAVKRLDFAEVADLYRLIDKDAIDVLVPYQADALKALLEEIKNHRYPSTEWLRRARPHAVNVYRPNLRHSLWSFLEPVTGDGRHDDEARAATIFRLIEPRLYDVEARGLLEAPEVWIG